MHLQSAADPFLGGGRRFADIVDALAVIFVWDDFTFHKTFTCRYVGSTYPLKQIHWPVTPAGFFLPVLKLFL